MKYQRSTYTYTQDQLIEAIKTSYSYAQILRKLNLKAAGGNYQVIKQRIKELNLNIDHFNHKPDTTIKINYNRPKLDTALVFTENSNYNRNRLKERLISEFNFEYCCSICKLKDWHGKKLSLHLDHINGINNDNRVENLRLLCPNCHSLTDTYCGKNKISTSKSNDPKTQSRLKNPRKKKILESHSCLICNTQIFGKRKKKYCSTACYHKSRKGKDNLYCRKVERPSKEVLELEIKTNSFLSLGRKYGVSDNAIRKWCRSYKII